MRVCVSLLLNLLLTLMNCAVFSEKFFHDKVVANLVINLFSDSASVSLQASVKTQAKTNIIG